MLPALAALATLALAACGDDAPPPPAAGGPPVVATSFDVTPCLIQFVSPGRTVAILVIPDTLSLDVTRASSFPNGRALPDPVIDRTLAMIFLDLTQHSIDTFRNLPVNPPANDRAYRTSFPWLAMPQGSPPLGAANGSGFTFRADAPSAYVRVDRMGMPAIATALIGSAQKDAYNDDDPTGDATYRWVPTISNSLTALTNALADDFSRLGLRICARPN